MRGKDCCIRLLCCSIRITPAYAGKRRPLLCPKCTKRDHPRVCGEKNHWWTERQAGGGSPPRMRGKATILPKIVQKLRITPAYAGKSIGHRRTRQNDAGSPPRMRGKVAAISAYNAAPGITPAYAGKRQNITTIYCVCQDHPRVCGEKFTQSATKTTIPGSPPRMRGKD